MDTMSSISQNYKKYPCTFISPKAAVGRFISPFKVFVIWFKQQLNAISFYLFLIIVIWIVVSRRTHMSILVSFIRTNQVYLKRCADRVVRSVWKMLGVSYRYSPYISLPCSSFRSRITTTLVSDPWWHFFATPVSSDALIQTFPSRRWV